MKKSMIRNLWGLVVLLSLSMCFSSCEGLGEWSRPLPDPIPVTSISLNETNLSLNVADADGALTATVEPQNADYDKIIWSSSDESIATVDETGIIHAVAEGNVTITAQAGDKTATCDVQVTDNYSITQYKEASFDGSKVVFTKKNLGDSSDSYTEIKNGYTATQLSGWYTVTGDNVTIGNDVELTGDVHLILCDGAKLTINGILNCGLENGTKNYNLYIYGQKEGTGNLTVIYTHNAISYVKNLEIHGGKINPESTQADAGYAINLKGGGNFDLYGGEVNAIANNPQCISISSTDNTLTVYGGKLYAEAKSGGQAIHAMAKSGTPNIKFYFTNDKADWGTGTVYTNASGAPSFIYAKAE